MSEYDVISNFSSLVSSKMRFFCTFFISQPTQLTFGTEIKNWMLILLFDSISGFGDNFGQYDTKAIIFGQIPVRNSIAMATPKVPSDQKLFERVCHMSKLKVTKFQLSTPNGF